MTKPAKDTSKEKPKKNPQPSSKPLTAPTPMGHYSSEPSEAWAEAIEEGVHTAYLNWLSKQPKPK